MDPLAALEAAVARQADEVATYSSPSAAKTLELVRAIDRVVMGELLDRPDMVARSRELHAIMGWGVAHALAAVLPRAGDDPPLRLFPSLPEAQGRVDDLLFASGALSLGERMLSWLRQGLVEGRYRELGGDGVDAMAVLELRTLDPSFGSEAIGRSGLRWEGEGAIRRGRRWEEDLVRRWKGVKALVDRGSRLVAGHLPACEVDDEVLALFEEAGRHYTERMPWRDLLAPDDLVGGMPFGRYVEALQVISGLHHLHVDVMQLLRQRHPDIELRDLMTWPMPTDVLIRLIEDRVGVDSASARRLLDALTLDRDDLPDPVAGCDQPWPALIRLSDRVRLQPMFGLDVNPYLFLLAKLRRLHREEWDEAANRREHRWQEELRRLVEGPRWRVNARGTNLTENGRRITDVDFSAYDPTSGDLLLFQLKWQHPFGSDEKARRSMAANLVGECNKWVGLVSDWLDRNGAAEMASRLSFRVEAPPRPRMVVVGRYNAWFGGSSDRDGRAAWTSWAHLRKAWLHVGDKGARALAARLVRDAAEARARHRPPAMMVPVGGLGVILNPSKGPK